MFTCTQELRDYMEKGIRHAAMAFGRRSAGSRGEAACQAYFRDELSEYADRVEMDEFTLHPKAFLGWLVIAGIFDLLSVALYWGRGLTNSIAVPILAAVLICCSFFMDLLEFVLYRRFVDKLFPSAVSHNVFACRAAADKPQRRIVFCGHADAAYEMTFARHGGKKTLGPVLIGSSLGMLYMMALNITVLVRTLIAGPVPLQGMWGALGIVGLLFLPFFAGILVFVNWRRVVDGANDNLTGCYTAMGVLRLMAKEDIRFENTEVCCLITGAEEAGLRGALSFARERKAELSEMETVFIALDTMREMNQLMVYTRGQNGMQANSAKVGNLLARAAQNLGHPFKKAGFFLGATDAEALSRYGLQACAFCGVNHDPQPYYHTREDNADNLDMDCVSLSLHICMEAARLYDEAGGIHSFAKV